MDWSAVFLFMMVGASWGFVAVLGMNLGIRLERFRRDKEVDAYVIPEDRLSDSDYWKIKYEDLAEEMNAMYPSDQVR